jgi:signal transduction histidine kinase
MRQRLVEIGGECKIESHPGKGTVITVELPLAAA